jgi:formylglycine-generating enzyme required for sulfatase activity
MNENNKIPKFSWTESLVVYLILVFCISASAEPNDYSESNAKNLQIRAAAEANLPIEKTIMLSNDANMVFVFIPAGEFEMGSPKTEKKRDGDEGPVHQAKITKSFYMSKYEVTQIQYRAIMGIGKKCYFNGFDLPVDSASMRQSTHFCNALSEKVKIRFRLPTEAEWEYACRAGTTTPFNTGETLNSSQANYDASKTYGDVSKATPIMKTAKVGSYPPNQFGLYDMHGNVWEWCSDKYIKNLYNMNSEDADQLIARQSYCKVIRGGGWDSSPNECRSANRDWREYVQHKKNVGFRVVMEIVK